MVFDKTIDFHSQIYVHAGESLVSDGKRNRRVGDGECVLLRVTTKRVSRNGPVHSGQALYGRHMGKDVERFLTDCFFGEFYSRGVLDLPTRELLGYCVLVSLGAERQLRSHYLPYVGFPVAIKALRVIQSVARLTGFCVEQSGAPFENHLKTPHFKKYKQGTFSMVKERGLVDATPLIPDLKIK